MAGEQAHACVVRHDGGLHAFPILLSPLMHDLASASMCMPPGWHDTCDSMPWLRCNDHMVPSQGRLGVGESGQACIVGSPICLNDISLEAGDRLLGAEHRDAKTLLVLQWPGMPHSVYQHMGLY